MAILWNNGVALAEKYNPLEDGVIEITKPDTWHGPHVLLRYSQGYQIMIKQRAGRLWPAQISNTWPDYQMEWLDMLARLGDGGEAHDAWVREQNWTPPEPPSAKEISHCDRALAWPGRFLYLKRQPEILIALNLYAHAKAFNLDPDRLTNRRRHFHFYPGEIVQCAFMAAEAIAHGLNREGETVF
jgi:hypothetical protein